MDAWRPPITITALLFFRKYRASRYPRTALKVKIPIKMMSASKISSITRRDMDSLYIKVSGTVSFTIVASVFNPTEGVRIYRSYTK